MAYGKEVAWVGGDGVTRVQLAGKEENPCFRRRGTVLAVFLYLWLMVAFVTGTGVLVGPAGWVSHGLQRVGAGQKVQDHAMQAVILIFVVGSAALALWLVRLVLHGSRRTRVAVPLACTLAALLSLWAWMNPGRMLAAMAGGNEVPGELATASGARFIFGAYPDEATLRRLKHDGVTAVISLQHPAVVPFEPASIETEKRAARVVGLRFIHAPMLPWVSDNRAALEQIRQIAHQGSGLYYVHCGLGRDRTNVVRRMLEAEGVKTASHSSIGHASTFADRARERGGVGRPFQRGLLRQLAPGVWLTPYPNPAEFSGYFEAGQVRAAVFVLDTTDAAQRAWLAEGQRILAAARVPTSVRPLKAGDLAGARALAAWARTQPGPLALIAPVTPYANQVRYPGTETAGALMDAFVADAPTPAANAARGGN
jgi:hypothetical protein